MGTELNIVAAQDVKRRGLIALEEKLGDGPVYVVKRNRPVCVVLTEADFRELSDLAATARLTESLADVHEGRVREATPAGIMDEIDEEPNSEIG